MMCLGVGVCSSIVSGIWWALLFRNFSCGNYIIHNCFHHFLFPESLLLECLENGTILMIIFHPLFLFSFYNSCSNFMGYFIIFPSKLPLSFPFQIRLYFSISRISFLFSGHLFLWHPIFISFMQYLIFSLKILGIVFNFWSFLLISPSVFKKIYHFTFCFDLYLSCCRNLQTVSTSYLSVNV